MQKVGWAPGWCGVCVGSGVGLVGCLYLLPPRWRLGPVSLWGDPSITSAGSAAGPSDALHCSVAPWLWFVLIAAGDGGEKGQKKHNLGLNLGPGLGLGGTTHPRGVGDRNHSGNQVHRLCATWLGFEIARRLQNIARQKPAEKILVLKNANNMGC